MVLQYETKIKVSTSIQMTDSNKFQMFNYESAEKNREHYGQVNNLCFSGLRVQYPSSIVAAPSYPVHAPPQAFGRRGAGSCSRTAAGNRAYPVSSYFEICRQIDRDRFFRDLPPLFRNMVSLTIPSLCNLYLWPVLNNLFEDLQVTSDFLQS